MSDCDKFRLIPDYELFKDPVSRCDAPNLNDNDYVKKSCVPTGPKLASKMKSKKLENDEELKELKNQVAELYEQDSKCRSNKGGKKSKKNRKRRVRKTRKYKGGMEPAACSSSSSERNSNSMLSPLKTSIELLKKTDNSFHGVTDAETLKEFSENCHDNIQTNFVQAAAEIEKYEMQGDLITLEKLLKKTKSDIFKYKQIHDKNRKHISENSQRICKSKDIDPDTFSPYLFILKTHLEEAIEKVKSKSTHADTSISDAMMDQLLLEENQRSECTPKKKSPGKSRKKNRR